MTTHLITQALLQHTIDTKTLTALLTLTPREVELLCHLTNDPTEAEIADRMCITCKSVENLKTRVGDKLNLKGCRAVRRFAQQHRHILDQLLVLFEKQPAMKPLNDDQATRSKAGGYPLKNWGENPSKIEGITPYFFSFAPPTFVPS